MKKANKVLSIFFLNFLFNLDAQAYKYVIVTDEADPKKSQEVIEVFKNTYPFNTFKVEFEILKVKSNILNCDSTMGIKRLITCNDDQGIQNLAQERGADQVMVVKELSKYGGSAAVGLVADGPVTLRGGGVPVITTSTDAKVMIHEYMHTLGLCDQYKFSKSEAVIYCKEVKNAPNLAYIIPEERYFGDADARRKHIFDIPWYDSISKKTLITNSSEKVLGTGAVDLKSIPSLNTTMFPTELTGQVGLFRSDVCDNATPPVPTWQPDGGATIMTNNDAGLGAYSEKLVDQMLLKRGMKKKLDNSITSETAVVQATVGEASSSVITDPVSPEPNQAVNNSSRGFFKSFFSWIGDLIRQIGNAMTR